MIETFEISKWDQTLSDELQKNALLALESGKVVYFPHLAFFLSQEEKRFLSPEKVDPKSKNVSYNGKLDKLAGTLHEGVDELQLKTMIKRFHITAKTFLERLIPQYRPHVYAGKTSFRPVEIFGRKSSYRKDDTLLHVDSFPSNPTRGRRILRLFTNINHEGKPRVWRVGEPFERVVEKMGPKVSHPVFGVAHLLKLLKITKDKRSPYDHYMLQIHNLMKADCDYQRTVEQREVRFAPGSSWMVYTDQVSHAAMSGQHVLEQTFHLPVEGIQHAHLAPLKVLERYFKKGLL